MLRDSDAEIRMRTDQELPALKNIHMEAVGGPEALPDQALQTDAQIFYRMALSCLADADHSDTALHYGNDLADTAPAELKPEVRLGMLDRYIKTLPGNDERSRLRREMYQSCRDAVVSGGFVSCDSPVGSGKTTAVMAHLLRQAVKRKARRVFVILPYTNIIRQSADVYRRALVLPGEDPEAVVAEVHHRADYENEDLRQLTALWRAPVVVTTAVAFFETLASNRPSTLRRLHELPGSVIFMDEAHAALPVRLLPLAWRWIHMLQKDWGCYWVFASGSLVRFWTIPELTDLCPEVPELVGDQLRDRLMQYENHRIEFLWRERPLSRPELEDWVTSQPGPRLVIMNTVQSAAVIARDLQKKYGRSHVEHLSTALTAADRSAVIDRIQKRLKDKTDNDWTLVSTSCVEAGVDFSFRSGFREISSLLSLLQTAGRISRGGEYEDAQIWSFSMQDDPMLKRNPDIEHSAIILRSYFEQKRRIEPALSTRAIRDELIQYDKDIEKRERLMKKEKTGSFKTVADEFHVIESNTVPVLVSDRIAEQVIRGKGDWRLIQKHTVSISQYKLRDWGVAEIRPGLYRWNLAYDNFVGYMAGVMDCMNLIL